LIVLYPCNLTFLGFREYKIESVVTMVLTMLLSRCW